MSIIKNSNYCFLADLHYLMNNIHPFEKSGSPQEASLVARSAKNLTAMQDTWVWSLGQEIPLEEETATQLSILAWKIPWREELGRLESMGSQRVGHD